MRSHVTRERGVAAQPLASALPRLRSSENKLHALSSKNGDSAGNVPVFSYSTVSLRVSILLASTSGWLKALMPITEPATAVANLPAEKFLA